MFARHYQKKCNGNDIYVRVKQNVPCNEKEKINDRNNENLPEQKLIQGNNKLVQKNIQTSG